MYHANDLYDNKRSEASCVGSEHNFSVDGGQRSGPSIARPRGSRWAGSGQALRRTQGRQCFEGNSYRSSTLNVAKR